MCLVRRLFCISKCSQYLTSLSKSAPSAFARLSVLATRFLLVHGAALIRKRGSSIEDLGSILEMATSLLQNSTGGLGTTLDLSAKQDVIAVLVGILPSAAQKGSSDSQSTRILEAWLELSCFSKLKSLTRLCVLLVRTGGFTSLKVCPPKLQQHYNHAICLTDRELCRPWQQLL